MTRRGFVPFADVSPDMVGEKLQEDRKRNPYCYVTSGPPFGGDENMVGIYGITGE